MYLYNRWSLKRKKNGWYLKEVLLVKEPHYKSYPGMTKVTGTLCVLQVEGTRLTKICLPARCKSCNRAMQGDLVQYW